MWRRRRTGTTLALLFAGLAAACSGPGPTGPTAPATSGPPASPAITAQPQSQTVPAGGAATLSLVASGTGPLTYQWYLGDSGSTSAPVAGATAATFTTPPLQQTASFWARVTNSGGSADSASATITVAPPEAPVAPPRITTQPDSETIAAGDSAKLDVGATGDGPLHFQWFVGASGETDAPIPGATTDTYRTPPMSETSAFWVRVENAAGVADSETAIVTVSAELPPSTEPPPDEPPPAEPPPPEPPPPPDPPTPSPSSNAAFEDEVLTLVNQHRASGATCGGTAYPAVPALTMNASVRSAARAHSADMASQGYFSHTSLDGRSFDDRMSDAGYGGPFPWGENIAAGYPTPQAVVDGWMASPGHCTNIMKAGFKVIGVGHAFLAASPYGHYWTQNFGGG